MTRLIKHGKGHPKDVFNQTPGILIPCHMILSADDDHHLILICITVNNRIQPYPFTNSFEIKSRLFMKSHVYTHETYIAYEQPNKYDIITPQNPQFQSL